MVFFNLKFELLLRTGLACIDPIFFFVKYFFKDLDLREMGLFELECDFSPIFLSYLDDSIMDLVFIG